MLARESFEHPILSRDEAAEVSRRVLVFDGRTEVEKELFEDICEAWEQMQTALDAISRARS